MKILTLTCLLISSGICFGLSASNSAKAQIVPDTTLPQNSRVSSQEDTIRIEGGTRVGDNLFHSFKQFSVSTGNTASFYNAIDVQNIFSRVTGKSISEIDGLIRANGTANLFLINPNGIIFGENTSLDIGGSFLSSTASSIHFADGTQFSSTRASQNQPLLTVTAPVGLGFEQIPGEIINRSRAEISSPLIGRVVDEDVAGLRVEPGKTLALVGGNVVLEGGNLTANGGRIEIGSVAGNSSVILTSTSQGLVLDYQEVQNFQDISLFPRSIVDTSGERGGDIQIQGRRVTLTGNQMESPVLVFSNTVGAGVGGTLAVSASEALELKGNSAGLSTQTSGSGTAGNLMIETRELTAQGGANIVSVSSMTDDGPAGNIKVFATESVELIGIRADGLGPTNLSTIGFTGNAGNLTIKTERLLIRDGAQVLANTFGKGQGGELRVIDAKSVEIVGTFPGSNTPSGLFTQVERGATGEAGNLTIETERLTILDGAQISTSARNGGQSGNLNITATDSISISGTSSTATLAEGSSGIFSSANEAFKDQFDNLVITTVDAGDLVINTGQLTVEEGAKISADNFGTGEGGSITLNVSQLTIQDGGLVGAGSLVEPIGVNVNLLSDGTPNRERGIGGTLTVNAFESIEIVGTGIIGDTPGTSSLFTRAEGTGDAGNLNITTPNLTVAEAGNINVSATGTGQAGSLNIKSQDVTLDNGSFTATTRRGDRGNITLSNADTLLLRNNSEITTNASEDATGGNITITSELTALLDDSDITANAFRGRGGNIQINAQGLFQEPDSDIDAASDLGIDGTITINNPEVDPTSGIVELPSVPIDAAAILAQDLCRLEDDRIAGGSSFIITGRGGITPTSEDPLVNRDQVVNWANREDIKVSESGRVGVRQRVETAPPAHRVIRSQGWVRTADGSVWLTASAPETILQSSIVHPDCRAMR